MKEIVEVTTALMDWIDAIPDGTELPEMPPLDKERVRSHLGRRETGIDLLAWIDAIPQEVELDSMPGMDRDWVETVLFQEESLLNKDNFFTKEHKTGEVWVDSDNRCVAVFEVRPSGTSVILFGEDEPPPGRTTEICSGAAINDNEDHGHWRYVATLTPDEFCEAIFTAAVKKYGDSDE